MESVVLRHIKCKQDPWIKGIRCLENQVSFRPSRLQAWIGEVFVERTEQLGLTQIALKIVTAYEERVGSLE